MIIKNNITATDIQNYQRTCWEVRKSSIRGYAKTVISYGSWSAHREPETIPSISWEGGTTVNCKCWVERNKLTRIGFDTYTVTEKKYLIPSFNYYDCTVNETGNNADGFTLTIGKYDNSTSDRLLTGSAQYVDETGRYGITVTVTQTKRDKVTVTFNANGGTIADNTSMQEFVIPGNTVNFENYTPVYPGHIFYGWSISSTATTGSMSGNSVPINSPITFYATWKTPVVGDVLYSTAVEKLTLDAQTNGVNNTPIAICVIPDVYENFEKGDKSAGGVHTARFVSINYMNCDTPKTGSKDIQKIYFGNNGVTIGSVKGELNSTSYVGGKWNTKQCVKSATKQNKNIDAPVINNGGAGYCAPACCCVRYSTPGTKSGDWYLPSVGELYQIYANKTVIYEKRKTLVGSEFIESDDTYNNYACWSSIEITRWDQGVGYVCFSDGYYHFISKVAYNAVLAFLAI